MLVANRGEIAVRVIRSCRELGIETVLATSTVDRDGMAARMADRAVRVGPAPASDSYLSIPALLSAALGTGCDAVHPGYGFLAENPEFAAACVDKGLVFVGPRPEAVAQAGDKARARELARSAGIPVLAGSAVLGSVDAAAKAAVDLGYPVLVKAAAGGGGRGMRVMADETELRDGWAAAVAEATSAFGDGRLYVERFVRHARHVEVQVLGDRHGSVVHLGERDCTLQRRHQKVIEESPAPNLPDDVRTRIRAAGVAFARALGLDNAGTVEFIHDTDTGEFAFLEFNARIQVEHPVTEMVTGVDLVAEQLRAAAGERLTFGQDEIALAGHAIEVRVTAEDAARGFAPTPGTVTDWVPPAGEGIRVDSHCEPGYVVTPYYDSLLAKVVAHGPDRDTAADRMLAALGALRVSGIPTTVDFARFVLRHPDFRAGRVSTDWIAARGLLDYRKRRP
ncbi:MAG TPA: biotin carboxylase N-terminal domain-containing protein [Pseudonocardiaceae bacterium]